MRLSSARVRLSKSSLSPARVRLSLDAVTTTTTTITTTTDCERGTAPIERRGATAGGANACLIQRRVNAPDTLVARPGYACGDGDPSRISALPATRGALLPAGGFLHRPDPGRRAGDHHPRAQRPRAQRPWVGARNPADARHDGGALRRGLRRPRPAARLRRDPEPRRGGGQPRPGRARAGLGAGGRALEGPDHCRLRRLQASARPDLQAL